MIAGFMLDTSACIDILKKRNVEAQRRLRTAQGTVYLSTVVLMELAVGPAKTQNERRADLLDAFISRLELIDFDQDAARHTADIRADLERRGRPIGPYDYQIAGHARSRGLTVVTGNVGEFSRVEGLLVENWSSPLRGFHE